MHERFVQAAANTDQIADSTAAGQQPQDAQLYAALHSGQPFISHTPAPHLPDPSDANLSQQELQSPPRTQLEHGTLNIPASGENEAAGQHLGDSEAGSVQLGSVGVTPSGGSADANLQSADVLKTSEMMTDTGHMESPSQQAQASDSSESDSAEEQMLQDSPESTFVSNEATFASQTMSGNGKAVERRPLAAVQEGHHAVLRTQLSKQSSLQQQGMEGLLL